MRFLSLAFGILLIGFGGIQTFALIDPSARKTLCRTWLCWEPAMVDESYTSYLHGSEGPEEFSTDLKQSLRHDPASGFRWCDFGEAVAASGDRETAHYCIRRAVALSPNSALVLLRAANVILLIGDNSEALHLLAGVLKLTSEFDPIVFSTFDRFGEGVDAALKSGLPDDKRAGQSFLRYLIAKKRDPRDVAKAWDWLVAKSLIDKNLSVEYVNYLVAARQFNAATEAWVRVIGPERGDYLRPNRVFNGNFALRPSGARLDWHSSALPDGVQLTWALGEGHSGGHSLRLDFDAQQNISFNHIYQEAIMEPGRYEFMAFVKARQLTTDQGVGFHIFDLEVPARLDITVPPASGTMPWTEQKITFLVPPPTRLLRIELRREPSRKFDNKIKGTLWVDSVKLQPFPALGRPIREQSLQSTP